MNINHGSLTARGRKIRYLVERKYFPYLLLIPAILLVVIVLIYPILFGMKTMFFKWNYAQPTLGKVFVGFGNFIEILHDGSFWQSIKNTFIYTAGSVFVSFIIGFALALLMSEPFKGRSAIRVLIMLPVFIVPVVIALLWRILYNGQFGIIPYILNSLGIIAKGTTPLGTTQWTMIFVLIVAIWQVTPFYFLVLVAGLQAIPIEQYEVAKIDGANKFQEFFHITLPWMKYIIMFVLLITTIDAFKVFDIIYILTGGGPGNATEVVSYYIYRQGFQFFQVGYASALSFIILIIEAIVAVVFLSLLRQQKEI